MSAHTPRGLARTLALLVSAGVLLALAGPVLAQDDVVDEIYSIEENYYYPGNYKEAVVLLDRILARPNLTSRETIEARSLKARCLVNLDQVEEARGLFEQNLREDPDWGLDPTLVLDREYAIYQDVREKALMARTGATEEELTRLNNRLDQLMAENRELRRMSTGSKKFYENWWFAPLTAGVVGGVVALIVSGGEDEEPPPEPTTGGISIVITPSEVVSP
jgi:tetratricopeptide (TPR) repeat protein